MGSRFGFRTEPVAVAAAIRALLLVGIAFGLDWTEQQMAAVMLAVELVLALVLRTQVTSESTMRLAGTSTQQVKDVAGDPYSVLQVKRSKHAPPVEDDGGF